MIEGIECIFADMKQMLRKLKKKNYESQMAEFRKIHGHYFEEMNALAVGSDDTKAAVEEIADTFVNSIFAAYSKNGKMRGTTEVDLSMFMIYYVFPAVLLLETDESIIIADAIKAAWAVRFNNPNFDYNR